MREKQVSRRSFLQSSLVLAGAVATRDLVRAQVPGRAPDRIYELVAQPANVEVAPGQWWSTWTYNGQFPGPALRAVEGELVRITLENRLDVPTTIHWHGVPVPNAMDGVPDITQPAIAPRERFVYEFVAGPPGTYFYHSHVGLQLDRGLLGSLVIERKRDDPEVDDARFDREVTVVLDDWLNRDPEVALAEMNASPHRGPMMGGSSDPAFAGYLLNGRKGGHDSFTLSKGERLRLRIINASAATTHRFGVTGHRLRVTHTDGQSVRPVDVDTLTIGMGERYDVVVLGANPGAWWMVAGPADSVVPGVTAPLVYPGYAAGRVAPAVWPSELSRGVALRYVDLHRVSPGTSRQPDRTIPLVLAMGAQPNTWTINGQAWPDADPIRVARDERVRLSFINQSPVRHPMHLHGHFFDVVGVGFGMSGGMGPGRSNTVTLTDGPRKDTVIVEPMMGRVDVDFTADNPGQWLLHCHHAYHMEMGMMRVVEVNS